MGRPRTDEEKARASERQQAHWKTIRSIAGKTNVRAEFVSMHWKEIKPIAEEVISGNRMAIAMVRGLVAQEAAAKRLRATATSSRPPGEEERVKIMKWAIRTCGHDIGLAREAFDKAASELR